MQLIIDIKDEFIVDKVKNLLSTFKDKDIQIKEIKSTNIDENFNSNLTDKYIEENWQEVVSEALKDYKHNYKKSFQSR
jgi:hypothetical protein